MAASSSSSSSSPMANREPIAIIGTGCRFPGGADSPSRLWDLLRDPRDVLSEIPPSRFDTGGFHHTDSQFPGHANVKHSYLLEGDVAEFDAQFFNITAAEAVAMDPQQRLLLETVYEGLERAGQTVEGLRGSNTGVYVGVMYVDYESLQFRDLQHIPTYLAIGTARSIISNRISYFFDWHGPSLTVDTACSSSLVALHQAVHALRSGEVRIALAAGSNLLLGPEPYIHESKLNMLSPDGRSRMWDRDANGYARGDGVAAVVLKTLSAALADGDHVEAVIRETGVNQDGRSRGITMPSAAAQAALIRETYARAGLDPASPADRCQYFEAHGTGTPAGDPVEAEAVHTAFFGSQGGEEAKDKEQPLLVGSIKTVIGHTESTAGLAGILKVVQAMRHGHVPPNMLLKNLNPNVLPFYRHLEIPQALTPWPALPSAQSRRRASVNSFGFGGTNAHVILESFDEPPFPEARRSDPAAASVSPFLFSAQSKQSLRDSLAAYAQYLAQHPDTSPVDLAWTLRARRSRLPLRVALPASTIEALQAALVDMAGGDSFQLESKSATTKTKQEARLLGVFTGQGAQWARMGAELVETSEHAASILAAMDEALRQLPAPDRPAWTLRDQLLAPAAASQVGSAAVAQPLCTAVQVVLVELLRLCGVRFAVVVGHSSGEIAAAFAAGFLSRAEAIRIAYYRGLHSRLAAGPGGVAGAMLAVGTDRKDAEGLCADEYFAGRVRVAACNSASSLTLSGDEDAIADMADIFEDESKFVRRLRVDKAYHSHHMLPCSQPYLDSMAQFPAEAASPDPGCTWVSSVHLGRAVDASCLGAQYWVDNLLSPVLFAQAVEHAVRALGPFDAAVEVGPHPALKGPVLDTLRDLQVEMPYTGVLERNRDAVQSVSRALGHLWKHVDHLHLDFDRYEAAMAGRDVAHRFLSDLPTYQWNHGQRYWHESPLSRRLRTRSHPVHPLLGDLQPQSSDQQLSWKAILRPQDLPWVHHHRIQGQTVFPAAAYAVTAMETASLLAKGRPVRLLQIEDLVIHQALVFGNDDQRAGTEVRSVISNIRRDEASGHLAAKFTYEALMEPQNEFHLVASCDLSLFLGDADAEALPATARLEPYMVELDTDLAYESLKETGYGYTGPFKALSGMKRKLGKASGSLALEAPGSDHEVLTVHPAVLDAAFHSIILAFSYPQDGRLWTLHLPTRIQRIRVNPALCGRHWANAGQVPFVATMSDRPASGAEPGFQGDVEIHDSTGAHTAIQVEGMSVVPLAPVSAADDQQQFYTTHWFEAEPNADRPGEYAATDEEKAMAAVLERGSYFYLRQLDAEIPADHPGRSDRYHAAYLSFAAHTNRLAAAGQHRYLRREWARDTFADIAALTAPYADRPEVRAMHVVGANMARAVRGETTMLEQLMAGGLLAAYYAEALSVTRGTALLAETVVQITRRHPAARILEAGAGTGGATREILGRLDGDFAGTYTFTDVSAAFFDGAQAEFAAATPGDGMSYAVLDLEKDVAAQGFKEHAYDVVVASLVLHATTSLAATLRRVRALLRPGGYLVLFEVTNVDVVRGTALFGCLPGWWQGLDEGRTLGAAVSAAGWDAVLRDTGFSGVDSMTTPSRAEDAMALPNSVLVSQALDDWVAFLREPLLQPAPPTATGGRSSPASSILGHLFIVGGITVAAARLAADVQKLVRGCCDAVTRAESLETLDYVRLDAAGGDATVLVLGDLEDRPVFADVTPARWRGLQALFRGPRAIVWATRDRLVGNPFGSAALGFARSVVWEVPEVRYQFVDFQDAGRIDARALAEALVRFRADGAVHEQSHRGNRLGSVELEVVIDAGGRHWVPRMKPVASANDRYNSARRAITRDVAPSPTSPVVLAANDGVGGSAKYALHEQPTLGHDRSLSGSNDASPATVSLQVSHGSLRALRTSLGDAFVVLGRCTKTGTQYLGLSDSAASLVQVPRGRLVSCSVAPDFAADLLTSVATYLVLPELTRSLAQDEGLVVHDAPALVASALGLYAQPRGIRVLYTTSSRAVAQERGWVHVGPYLRQSEMRARLPANASRCLDFAALGAGAGPSIASCLPTGIQVIDVASSFPTTAKPLGKRHATEIYQVLQRALEMTDLSGATAETRAVPASELVAAKGDGPLCVFTVVRWDSEPVPVTVRPVMATFRPDRTYWLVGLSSDLGLSIADWMIKNGARCLVITSRNPTIDKAWIAGAEGRGAAIHIVACDLTDYDALATTHGDVFWAALPPLAGVYQGAMVLADSALQDMTREDFLRVLAPKITGSQNLDRLVGQQALDFFVFFSSVATVAGNPGQAAYTTANLFMSGLAQQRRRRGLAASVVELGLVMGLGYITREKGNVLTRPAFDRGLLTISEFDVHQTLAEAVRHSRPDSGEGWHLSIGLRQMAANVSSRPQWYSYPQYACFTSRDDTNKAGDADAWASLSVKDQLANASTREEVERITTDAFIAEMRNMLHLSEDYAITPAARTDELGLDSLVAVRIRSWFLNNCRVNIPALRILKGTSLEDLITQAIEEMPDEVVPGLYPTSSSSSEEASPASSESGGGGYSVATPPSVLSDSEIALASKEEDEEVKETGAVELLAPPSSLPPETADLERAGPLSYTQSVFHFVHALLPDKATLNNTVMLHLRGELRVPELARAVRALGLRHESLRSCVLERDGQPHQGVLKAPAWALEHRRVGGEDEIRDAYAALRGHVFDLARGESSRMLLLTRAAHDHYLLMSSHHLFFDRASNDAVMADLERLYHGGHSAFAAPTTAPALQYLDYANEQRRQHAAGDWDAAVDYWLREFAVLPEPLPLHRSRVTERAALAQYTSHIPEFTLDRALTARIRQVARAHRATPFHFHLSAFAVLLRRFLGTADVCVGIADSCRRDEHMATGVGPFLNMLPVRLAVDAGAGEGATAPQPFVGLLAEARQKSLAALAHSVPLEVILNALRVPRPATHTPLAQAFLNYAENNDGAASDDGQAFLGCRATLLRQHMAELPYDITFTVLNNNAVGDTRVLLNVQTSLYTASDATLLQHGYEDILREFVNDPQAAVGDQWQFRPPALQEVLALGRGPDFRCAWPATLAHRLESLAPTVASRVAVTDYDGVSLTYGQLAQEVDRVASALLAHGVGPGARVGVFQHPTARWVASLAAILKIGAVYVPLDVGTPVARLALMVRDCEPAALLVHGPTRDSAGTLCGDNGCPALPLIDVASLHEPCPQPVAVRARAEAPAAILYTSGSTGTPKGVVLRHSALAHEFEHCAATYGLGADDVVLQQSASSFDLSVTQIFLALGVGARLHVVPQLLRADAQAVVDIICREGVTATYATPTEYKSWLRRHHQADLRSSSHWRLALTAGEPVTEPLLQRFRETARPGLRLFNVYGPTETTCGSTKMELAYTQPAAYQARDGGTIIPVGRASANERFYILDDRQQLQPVGQRGEVVIGGVGTAMGYLNNDERTRSSFLPDAFATAEDTARGWDTMYRTGDVGYLQPDGTLVLQGRLGDDTEVKLNGVRVDLKDVEMTVLQAAQGVLADAVASLRYGTPDETATKFMVVHVVFAANDGAPDDGGRTQFVQALPARLPLARAMRPAAIIPADTLPRTVAGKVDRRATAALPIPPKLFHATTAAAAGQGGPALSKTETELRGLWEAVLPDALAGLYEIGAGSDFFTVGGNSLLLIELQKKIGAQLGVSLPLLQLFQASTLRPMAQLLGSVTGEEQEGGEREEDGSADDEIDWAVETAPPAGLEQHHRTTTNRPPQTPPRVVVLTGATGFVGQYLVRALVAQEAIQKVICLAVRNPAAPDRAGLLAQWGPKIEVHAGDLAQPRLGLTEAAAAEIFETADAVVHNGADVSHLKTYASLRAANVGATRALAALCGPRGIPLHYVSTTGVAMYYAPDSALAPVSVRDHAPPRRAGQPGYVASKWAGEVVLEKAHAAAGLPVCIHRPSSVLRPAADRGPENPAADVVQNMLDLSLRLGAVPALPGLVGFVDLVRPETVARDIVSAVRERNLGEGVAYVHESGDQEIDVAHIRQHLTRQTGEAVDEWPLELWIQRAEAVGLSNAMAAVFRGSLGDAASLRLPRILRE